MSFSKGTFDRRQLLRGAPAAAALIAVDACSREKPNGGSPYAPTFFSAEEWSFVIAAVARLIPSDGEGPGAVDVGVPEFIDRQMEMPYGHGAYFYLKGPFLENTSPTLGYQLRFVPREVYRLGIASANREAQRQLGKPFSELTVNLQDGFLQKMEHGEFEFSAVPAPVLFGQLLGNTREGYFSDPLYGGNRNMAAWKWIGFPGARADFTDWIDQPGKVYPYGPVSISGASG